VVAARISKFTEESVSVETQLRDGRKYAKGEDWSVVGALKDEDVSATEIHPLDRPELKEWLGRADEWDVLIFYKLDRIVRSPMDLWEMIQWCDDHGKYLVFVKDKFDLTTEMGRAMATIAAVFARMEVANTSQRLKEAFKTLRPTKRWTGKAPYGFTLVDAPDGKGKVLEPMPEAIAIIREAGLRFMDDAVPESGQAIAEDFNKRGILSPADFARSMAGRKVRGERWIGDSVRRLFQNPIYIGLKTFEGEPVIGDDGMPLQVVEPVFSHTEWKRLETRLKATAVGERNRTAGVASPYLGALVCKCGEPWYRCRQVRKDGREDVDRYYCRNKAHLRGQIVGLPKPSSVKTEVLNDWFEAFIMNAYGSIPKTRREFMPGEDHTVELERVEVAVARLRDDREAGDYDGEEAEYRRRLAALRDNRKRLSALPQRPDQWVTVETDETWAEWWASAGEEERRNELVRAGVKVYWFKPQGTPDMEMGLLADPRIGERLMDPTASALQSEPSHPSMPSKR